MNWVMDDVIKNLFTYLVSSNKASSKQNLMAVTQNYRSIRQESQHQHNLREWRQKRTYIVKIEKWASMGLSVIFGYNTCLPVVE